MGQMQKHDAAVTDTGGDRDASLRLRGGKVRVHSASPCRTRPLRPTGSQLMSGFFRVTSNRGLHASALLFSE